MKDSKNINRRPAKKQKRHGKYGELFADRVNIRGGDRTILQRKKRRCLTYCQVERSSTVLLRKGGKESHSHSNFALSEFKSCCANRESELEMAVNALVPAGSPEEHTPSLARRVTIESRSYPCHETVVDPSFHTSSPDGEHDTLLSPVKRKRTDSSCDSWAVSERAPASVLLHLQSLVEVAAPRFVPVKVKASTKRRGNKGVKRAISSCLQRASTL